MATQTVHQRTESNLITHEITALADTPLVISRKAGKIKSIRIDNQKDTTPLHQNLRLYDLATAAVEGTTEPDWIFSVHSTPDRQAIIFPDEAVAAFSSGLQASATETAATNQATKGGSGATTFNVTITVEEDS